MLRKLRRDEFLSFSQKLQGCLPESAHVINILLMEEKEMMKMFDFYRHEDDTKCFIVYVSNSSSAKLLKMPSFGVFCEKEDEKCLMEIMKSSGLIDWQKMLVVMAVEEWMCNPIDSLFKEMKNERLKIEACQRFYYDASKDKEVIRCPAGTELCWLGSAGITAMFHAWKFSGHINEEFFASYCQKVPCLGLFENPEILETYDVDVDQIPKAADERIPVSCIGIHYNGLIGFLDTKEVHRRKGYASVVLRVIARVFQKRGFYPVLHVVEDNLASLSLMRKVPGWERIDASAWLQTPLNC